MSNTLFEELTRQLAENRADKIGQAVGVDTDTARQAVPAALATLMGALAQNSADSRGAEQLSSALARDHDGGLLDQLDDFLDQAPQGPGEGILRHVLGARQPAAEAGLSRATGLDSGQVGQLLKVLAPIVLGALGKAKRQGELGATDLGAMLGAERQRLRRSAPAGGLDILGQFLDSDGDGDITDDVARIGGDLLGKFLRR